MHGSISMMILVVLLTNIFVFTSGLNVTFDPSAVEKLFVGHEQNVTISLHGDDAITVADDDISLQAEPESVLSVSFLPFSWSCDNFVCNRTIMLTGNFLGFGKVFVLQNSTNGTESKSSSKWTKLHPPLEVTVLRQDKIINKLFIIFVATVVTINYINFGCAIDINVIKEVLRRPIGPAVGAVCQFIIMPLVTYGVGYLLFTDPVLRLGLFTFGCSPAGGASNMWTVLLGGNLDLSITMTFISTVAAFGTIPLWLFTLGNTILKDTKIVVPYTNIMASLVSLVIPIAIGLLIQRFFPKVAARSKRILAPVCIVLLIGIIVMACIANTYIFYMLSWPMIAAASLSVWTGFVAGILMSMAFRFSRADIIAVSIETGIQNTGISFVLLSYSLLPPVSDMAAVVPVAGSIITPLPLFAVYCYMKIRDKCCRSDRIELQALKGEKEVYQSTNTVIDDLGKQGKELDKLN